MVVTLLDAAFLGITCWQRPHVLPRVVTRPVMHEVMACPGARPLESLPQSLLQSMCTGPEMGQFPERDSAIVGVDQQW